MLYDIPTQTKGGACHGIIGRSAARIHGYDYPQSASKRGQLRIQINKRIFEVSGGSLELKEATLYTAFRRMENSGYIISYWGNEGPGARRRYYSITVEGRNRLAEDQAAWKETRMTLDALLEESRNPSPLKDRQGHEIPVIRMEE